MDELVERGLIKAIRDLKTAQELLSVSRNNLYTDTICFNSQQAVEKLLKAYLLSSDIPFPKTHNLLYLKDLCSKNDKDFENLDVGGLTLYAIETRYPEKFYIPTLEESKKAFETALKIKEFVLKKFNALENDLTLF